MSFVIYGDAAGTDQMLLPIYITLKLFMSVIFFNFCKLKIDR